MRFLLHQLKEYTESAAAALKHTPYAADKKIISNLFSPQNQDYGETLLLRLTVIDSYYSTNMSKRFFGLENLRDQLVEVGGSDELLIKEFQNFLAVGNSKIEGLFENGYGFNRKVKNAGKAPSLITKYAYFLLDYRFPIYDSFAKSSLYKIVRRLTAENKPNLKSNPSYQQFFNSIKWLKDEAKVDGFDKLDNLLWLIGKMNDASFSYVLSEDKLKELLENTSWKPSGKESANVIHKYLSHSSNAENILSQPQNKIYNLAITL